MFPQREVVPWFVITIAIALYVHIRLDELTPQQAWRWGDDYRDTRLHPLINLAGFALCLSIIVVGCYFL